MWFVFQVEQLRHAEQGTDLFENHMAFVRSLTFDLNVDETTLILLLVIALFSPDRERLKERQLIADVQERCVYYIGIHLNVKYNGFPVINSVYFYC